MNSEMDQEIIKKREKNIRRNKNKNEKRKLQNAEIKQKAKNVNNKHPIGR